MISGEKISFTDFSLFLYVKNTVVFLIEFDEHIKPATGRPCVLTLGDSGTVPAITSDCSRVAYAPTLFRPVCDCVFENNAYVRK